MEHARSVHGPTEHARSVHGPTEHARSGSGGGVGEIVTEEGREGE